MAAQELKRRLTAILCADVVGYSRLMQDDEAATLKTLESYKTVIYKLVAQHYKGRTKSETLERRLKTVTP